MTKIFDQCLLIRSKYFGWINAHINQMSRVHKTCQSSSDTNGGNLSVSHIKTGNSITKLRYFQEFDLNNIVYSYSTWFVDNYAISPKWMPKLYMSESPSSNYGPSSGSWNPRSQHFMDSAFFAYFIRQITL